MPRQTGTAAARSRLSVPRPGATTRWSAQRARPRSASRPPTRRSRLRPTALARASAAVAPLAAAATIPGCGGNSSSTASPRAEPAPAPARRPAAASWRAGPQGRRAFAARRRGPAFPPARRSPPCAGGRSRRPARCARTRRGDDQGSPPRRLPEAGPAAAGRRRALERSLIVVSTTTPPTRSSSGSAVPRRRGAAARDAGRGRRCRDRARAPAARRRSHVHVDGQTRWSLAAGVAYLRALARGRWPGRARPRWSKICSSRRAARPRLGLRAAVASDTRLAMKVGVGTAPDGPWTVRQLALVGPRRRACVIAVSLADRARGRRRRRPGSRPRGGAARAPGAGLRRWRELTGYTLPEASLCLRARASTITAASSTPPVTMNFTDDVVAPAGPCRWRSSR